MRPLNLLVASLLLIGITGIGHTPATQNDRPAPSGTIELLVHDCNGKALANRSIQVLATEQLRSLDKAKAPLDTKTDGRGIARFPWAAGLAHLFVEVKGAGFAATATLELVPGRTSRASLPPHVPFGVIEGIVPKEVLKPEAIIRLPLRGRDDLRRARCDADGHFVFDDLPPGSYWLSPEVGDKSLGVEANVTVAPGQHVRSVFFHAPSKSTPSEPRLESVAPAKKSTGQPVWAEGNVLDENGRILNNADVFLLGEWHGGIRMYEVIRETRTDTKGRWQFEGPRDPLMTRVDPGAHLLVHKNGRPPACIRLPDYLDVEAAKEKGERASWHGDLVLLSLSSTSSLDVTVLHRGKPVANVAVQIHPQDGPYLRSRNYVGSARDASRDHLQEILYPVQMTDATGVAHFRELAPGSYQVTASDGGIDALADAPEFFLTHAESNYLLRSNIAVRSGEPWSIQVVLSRKYHNVWTQVLGPDGKPPSDEAVDFWFHPIFEWGRSMNALRESQAVWNHTFFDCGLWELRARFCDSPARRQPILQTPYHEVSAAVGVSPLLQKSPNVSMTAFLRRPGSLCVRLLDANGNPARGYVLLNSVHGTPIHAGATDNKGEIRFEGVQADQLELQAYLHGLALCDLGVEGDPLPDSKLLVGRVAVSRQLVSVGSDEEEHLVVRPKPVGFVRGTLQPASGRRCADYVIQSPPIDATAGSTLNYQKDTGEFVMGPFPEGKARILVSCDTPEHGWLTILSKEVEIRSERVARVTLKPPALAGKGQPGLGLAMEWWWSHFSEMEFIQQNPIRGKVFLSDGKTPASGCLLREFLPERFLPISEGVTDARGEVHMVVNRQGDRPVNQRSVGSPTMPVVVAWLPGQCGASIVPVKRASEATEDRKVAIVLPPSITVRGKVTVGGKNIQGQMSQFAVLAAHEGKGRLDDLLSLEVNTEANGDFELAGLTPGAYRIQAAMDRIWLSQSVRLIVDARLGKQQSVQLDIGQPGAASVIEVVDKAGKPVHSVKATIARPQGPLTAKLWPAAFKSDGAGLIHIPPLEAGAHKFRLGKTEKDQLLLVPQLLEPPAKPVRLRVVLD